MGNNRIVFIDQLKGLAMLAVVFNHLLQFCFGVNYTTTNTMLAIFDLPLFFFISGYFCYKERVFNVKETLSLLSKKFKNYVFPFLSVGLLYCFLFKQSVTDMILDGGGQILVSSCTIRDICYLYSSQSIIKYISKKEKVSFYRHTHIFGTISYSCCGKIILERCSSMVAYRSHGNLLSPFRFGYDGKKIC